MGKNEDLLARRSAVMPRGVPRATTTTAASAHGALIRDLDGNELIDFAGGIGVMNAGHTDPTVVQAIAEQAARLQHVCIHITTYEPYIELCEKLVTLLPHGGHTKAMLLNSGAEAVENAIKIARQATGRSGVLCYTGAFHGRTLMGMSLTSKVAYKQGCGPFAPEIYRWRFPNRFRWGDGLDETAFVDRELHQLREALHHTVAPENLAAILIEPVQGEGGFVPAPKGYLQGLRQMCDEHGIILIFDEVQTGFGRTGAWGAYQVYGVEPDLSTWAKAMGGGLPISAVVGKAEIMDGAVPGTLGGTYGGNPVACASALATIALMERDRIPERANRIGQQVRECFQAIAQDCTALADVRGLGAMIGAEFVEDGDPRRPATAQVAEIVSACIERGLLVISAGTWGNVIRVLSPLVISDVDLQRGLNILEEEIRRVFHLLPATAGVRN